MAFLYWSKGVLFWVKRRFCIGQKAAPSLLDRATITTIPGEARGRRARAGGGWVAGPRFAVPLLSPSFAEVFG